MTVVNRIFLVLPFILASIFIVCLANFLRDYFGGSENIPKWASYTGWVFMIFLWAITAPRAMKAFSKIKK